jgi:hypothetical protein
MLKSPMAYRLKINLPSNACILHVTLEKDGAKMDVKLVFRTLQGKVLLKGPKHVVKVFAYTVSPWSRLIFAFLN